MSYDPPAFDVPGVTDHDPAFEALSLALGGPHMVPDPAVFSHVCRNIQKVVDERGLTVVSDDVREMSLAAVAAAGCGCLGPMRLIPCGGGAIQQLDILREFMENAKEAGCSAEMVVEGVYAFIAQNTWVIENGPSDGTDEGSAPEMVAFSNKLKDRAA